MFILGQLVSWAHSRCSRLGSSKSTTHSAFLMWELESCFPLRTDFILIFNLALLVGMIMVVLALKVTASDEAPLRSSYKILNTICQGSFGEVKLACHLLTQTLVALKVLPRNSSIVTSEIDIMKSLSHPNVIKLYQIINTTVNTYIVIGHRSGRGLLDKVQEDGHLQREGPDNFTSILGALCITVIQKVWCMET